MPGWGIGLDSSGVWREKAAQLGSLVVTCLDGDPYPRVPRAAQGAATLGRRSSTAWWQFPMATTSRPSLNWTPPHCRRLTPSCPGGCGPECTADPHL